MNEIENKIDNIELPDFDTLVDEKFTLKTKHTDNEKNSKHPERCRCGVCGFRSKGKHPTRCQCEKCLQKAEHSDNKKNQDFANGISHAWTLLTDFMDNRFGHIPNYEKISKDEKEMLASSTAHVLVKYVGSFGYIEEITLIVVVLTIFGGRIQTVLNFAKEQKKQDN